MAEITYPRCRNCGAWMIPKAPTEKDKFVEVVVCPSCGRQKNILGL